MSDDISDSHSQNNNTTDETGSTSNTTDPSSAATSTFPVDRAYENGITLASSTQYDTSSDISIDWDQPVDTPEDVQAQAQYLATQAHYSCVATFVACGRMLKCETSRPDFDAKHVASRISQLKLQELNLWSRYLQKIDGDSRIIPELRACYKEVFAEDSDRDTLVALDTVGGISGVAYYQELTDFGDPVFQQIVEQALELRKQQVEIIEEYLQTAIINSDSATGETITTTTRKYRDLVETLFLDDDLEFINKPVNVPSVMDRLDSYQR